MKSFMEIGPHVLERSGRQTDIHTQTDAAALYIQIHVVAVGSLLINAAMLFCYLL